MTMDLQHGSTNAWPEWHQRDAAPDPYRHVVRRRVRRVGAALTALLVAAATVVLPVASAGAVPQFANIDETRYGGTDRYATSLLIAEAVAADAGGHLDRVVMVSGQHWTDAVVAAPLAGALGAPVLATPPGELRSDAAQFLRRTGVSSAVIVGADSDTDGVGPAVVTGLEALNISVERVARPDQYATSVAVARRLGTPGNMGGHGRTAIVASGEVFADALVAGAFAARGHHPILLTKPHVLRGDVARYITETGVEHVMLMGGTAALREAIEDSIEALGIRVTRLAGATRYDTAVAAAKLAVRRYSLTCFTDRRFGLARADVPFDSFSAAPLLARLCTPLLLADPDTIPSATAAYLDQLRASIASGADDTVAVHIFGGDAAISQTATEDYLGSGKSGVSCDIELGDKPVPIIGDVDATHPVWSPDCSRIAYVSRDAIWTASVDGTSRVRLTDGSDPDWSPYGKRIALARSVGRRARGETVTHIFVINADGTGRRQLTSATAKDTAPKWSPDGRRVLFERLSLSSESGSGSFLGYPFLATTDAEGRTEVEWDRRVYHSSSHSWTHDGERVSYRDVGGVATVLDDGTDWKPVWPVTLSDIDYSEYAWSADGCRIALAGTRRLDNGQWES